MFHKEGQKIILITFFLVSITVVLAHFYVNLPWLRITIQAAAIFLLLAILQFFRNPRRTVLKNFDEVLAPADGKVVVIEEVEEQEYFRKKRIQVSIFMSPVNVHVTRFPVSG